MRLRFELMQFDMGISTRRYLPASGTAGLARSLVKGNSRVPAPPPMITASTLLVFGDMRLPCVITKVFLPDISPFYNLPRPASASVFRQQQKQLRVVGQRSRLPDRRLAPTGACGSRDGCPTMRAPSN